MLKYLLSFALALVAVGQFVQRRLAALVTVVVALAVLSPTAGLLHAVVRPVRGVALPATAGGLPAGVTRAELPAGSEEGVNDWKRPGYGGPCPPVGRHRYFHKLYALDTRLEGLSRPTKATVEGAMQGHVIAQTELVGHYQKGR